MVNGNEVVDLDGRIYFSWFPIIGTKYEGKVIGDWKNWVKYADDRYTLNVGSVSFGEASITGYTNSVTNGNSLEVYAEGIVHKDAVKGNKEDSVISVRFIIPNFRHSYPEIKLEDEEQVIEIYRRDWSDFQEKSDALSRKGGYINLHSGMLTIKGGSMNHSDVKGKVHCLSTFLSFLNGRKTSPLFLEGMNNEKAVWTDFGYYYTINHYKSVIVWPQKTSPKGLDELWINFCRLWKDEGGRDFLLMAIHWYVEVNSGFIITETAIVTAQTCLELIYNWLIVEEKKILIGNDSRSISAAGKIRLLLSQLHVPTSAPSALSLLESFVSEDKQVADVVDAFVQIRNAIVHSHEKKRKKLAAIDEKTKYEALQLATWYIELSLLYVLNFQEKYYNRCSRNEKLVPYKR